MSTGKKPQVAPYSGAIFEIVALSGNDKFFKPSPQNSTNFPTTFFFLKRFVKLNTKSVAVTPSLSLFFKFIPITSGTVMGIGCMNKEDPYYKNTIAKILKSEAAWDTPGAKRTLPFGWAKTNYLGNGHGKMFAIDFDIPNNNIIIQRYDNTATLPTADT